MFLYAISVLKLSLLILVWSSANLHLPIPCQSNKHYTSASGLTDQ